MTVHLDNSTRGWLKVVYVSLQGKSNGQLRIPLKRATSIKLLKRWTNDITTLLSGQHTSVLKTSLQPTEVFCQLLPLFMFLWGSLHQLPWLKSEYCQSYMSDALDGLISYQRTWSYGVRNGKLPFRDDIIPRCHWLRDLWRITVSLAHYNTDIIHFIGLSQKGVNNWQLSVM